MNTLHELNSSQKKRSWYAYTVLLVFHIITMANNISSFEPTGAFSPQAIALGSPLHQRYPVRIATVKPLVPIEADRPSVKKKWYEVDTGIPPSRDFKPPLDTSRLISRRSTLLPSVEFADRHPRQFSPDTSTSSPPIARVCSNQPILNRVAYQQNRVQTYAMPYNNTAILPPEDITGTASLPC